MAIDNRSNRNPGSQAQDGFEAARNAGQQEQQGSRESAQSNPFQDRFKRQGAGFAGIGSFVVPPQGYRSNNDPSGKIRSAMEELMKEDNDPNYKIDLVHFPKGEPIGNASLAMSIIVMVTRIASQPNMALTYFTMIVESAAITMPQQQYSAPGSAPLNVTITPDMLYDAEFEQAVAKLIARRFSDVAEDMQFSTQAMVVHRTSSDVPNSDTLRNYLDVGYAATASTLFTLVTGQTDFKLEANPNDRQSIIQERQNHLTDSAAGEPEFTDMAGIPVRIDQRYTLKTGKQYNSRDRDYDQPQSLSQRVEQSNTLGWMGVATEFFHVPLDQSAFFDRDNGFGRGDDSRLQQFYVRNVITHMQTAEVPTLSRLLFILGIADRLRVPFGWYNNLRQAMRNRNPEMSRDLGQLNRIAVGHESAGIEIAPPASDEEERRFRNWLQTFCFHQPLVSIDSDLCGANTYYMRDFAEAARLFEKPNDPAARAAHERIIDAGMWLTNGRIAEYGYGPDRRDPVIFPESTLLHTGYFTGSKGQARAGGNIDLLWVLSQPDVKRDVGIAVEFNDTFFPESLSHRDRLMERRLGIIKSLAPSFKHTGITVRRTFENSYIAALANAIADNAVSVHETDEGDFNGSFQERRYSLADRYAEDRYTPSSLYDRGRGGRGGYGVNYRW